MLLEVRAGGRRNGQVALLNITNERAYRDSPLMSIDRTTSTERRLFPRKALPREIITVDENTTKIMESSVALCPITARRPSGFIKKMNEFAPPDVN